jgi:hypothetical protein
LDKPIWTSNPTTIDTIEKLPNHSQPGIVQSFHASSFESHGSLFFASKNLDLLQVNWSQQDMVIDSEAKILDKWRPVQFLAKFEKSS